MNRHINLEKPSLCV